MTFSEIVNIDIPKWAHKNAFLWIWATNSRSRSSKRPVIQQAFDLMEEWGFRYYAMLTWNKENGVCPFGPYQITSEYCLFGYRGKFLVPKESMGKMKTVFFESSKRHSEKPKIFYDNVRKYFHGPRLDVFARKRHDGFDAWGNEAEL